MATIPCSLWRRAMGPLPTSNVCRRMTFRLASSAAAVKQRASSPMPSTGRATARQSVGKSPMPAAAKLPAHVAATSPAKATAKFPANATVRSPAQAAAKTSAQVAATSSPQAAVKSSAQVAANSSPQAAVKSLAKATSRFPTQAAANFPAQPAVKSPAQPAAKSLAQDAAKTSAKSQTAASSEDRPTSPIPGPGRATIPASAGRTNAKPPTNSAALPSPVKSPSTPSHVARAGKASPGTKASTDARNPTKWGPLPAETKSNRSAHATTPRADASPTKPSFLKILAWRPKLAIKKSSKSAPGEARMEDELCHLPLQERHRIRADEAQRKFPRSSPEYKKQSRRVILLMLAVPIVVWSSFQLYMRAGEP